MDSPLRFPLTEVKETGSLKVDAEAPAALFASALSEGELTGPVSLSGIIRAEGEEAYFDGAAKGAWRFECTRCLAPVDGRWSERIEVRAPIDAGPLDLTEDVRQAICLAQPMKVLCGPDCKGFCSVCGKNRNLKDCGHAEGQAEASRRPRLTPRPDKG